MSFTYDLTTTTGKVRMELGDDTLGDGVKPDGSNFTDEEIQVAIDREGTVMRTVAALCETLANRWSKVADISIGPRRESLGQVGQRWAERAAVLRKQYGGGTSTAVFSFSPKRQDGFSAASAVEDDYGDA